MEPQKVATAVVASTNEYSVRPTHHTALQMHRLARRYWPIIGIPTAICILIGFHDWRWWAIAFIIFFVIRQIADTIAWVDILGRIDAMKALFPHVVSLTANDEIHVKYSPLITHTTEYDTDDDNNATSESRTITKETPPPFPTQKVIRPSNLGSLKVEKKRIVISFYLDGDKRNLRHEHLLIVPFSAFSSEEEGDKFTKQLTSIFQRVHTSSVNDAEKLS